MKRFARPRIVVPAVVALLGAFALVGFVEGRHAGQSHSGSGGSDVVSHSATAASSVLSRLSAGAPSSSTSQGSFGAAKVSSVGLVFPPTGGRYLVRTGDLTLLVPHGTVLGVMDRITAITAALRGYVLSSYTGDSGQPVPVPLSTDGGTQASSSKASATTMTQGPITGGSITVRIPSARLDLSVRRFSALGKVTQLSTSSSDVTSQYVDLRARLLHYQAVERRLLSFLARTTTIGEALTVQDRIDQAQLTVEQLTGQIKAISETIDYGTLTVNLTEKRAPAHHHHVAGFVHAFTHSLRLIGEGAVASFAALAALLPFTVLLAVLAVIAWLIRRRRHHVGRSSDTPQAPQPQE
jgi:hypothetical protein